MGTYIILLTFMILGFIGAGGFIKDIDKVHLVMVHFIQKGGWAVERNRQVHVGIIFPEELNQFGHLAFAQGLDHPEVKRLSWRFFLHHDADLF